VTTPNAAVEQPAAEAQLYIEVATAGRVTTLRLVGTVNVYTVPLLVARIDDAVKHGAWSIVVSLEQVEQVDGEVAIGTLLRALRRMQGLDGYLAVADPRDLIRRAVKARGLALVLAVFPAEETAVDFLASWRAA
jgi:anti-anti-sigma factor